MRGNLFRLRARCDFDKLIPLHGEIQTKGVPTIKN